MCTFLAICLVPAGVEFLAASIRNAVIWAKAWLDRVGDSSRMPCSQSAAWWEARGEDIVGKR